MMLGDKLQSILRCKIQWQVQTKQLAGYLHIIFKMKSNLKDFDVTSKSMVFPTSNGGGLDFLHSSYGVPPTSPKPNKSRPLYNSQLQDKSTSNYKSLLIEQRFNKPLAEPHFNQTYDKGTAKQQCTASTRNTYDVGAKPELNKYYKKLYRDLDVYNSLGSSIQNLSHSFVSPKDQYLKYVSPRTQNIISSTARPSPRKHKQSWHSENVIGDRNEKYFKKSKDEDSKPVDHSTLDVLSKKKYNTPKQKGSSINEIIAREELSNQKVRDYLRLKLMSPTQQNELHWKTDKSTRKFSLKEASHVNFRIFSISDFQIGKCKGDGKFGKVYPCRHKQTGMLFAMKEIQKDVIKANMMQNQLAWEIKLQTFFNHSNIVKMYGFFADRSKIYLLMEYMEQGSLFEYLKRFRNGIPEDQVSRRMKEMCSAVAYLHDLEVAHRDIKPENIVLSNGVAKLCDFGWSTRTTDRRTTYCGTFDYAPPEILEGKDYDHTVDLWSLGVLAYELLTGKLPFYSVSRKETMKNIIGVDKKELSFPSGISREAKDFIHSLLKKQPDQRKQAERLLKHPFLEKYKEKLY